MIDMPNMDELNMGDFKPVLRITPKDRYIQIEPGNSEEFEIKVKNIGDEEVKIEPKMVVPEWFDDIIEEDWITILPKTDTLKKDETKTITIKITIPDDAEQGYYNAQIAFTNRTFPASRGGFMENARYVETLNLNVEVFIPPVVKIQRRYIEGLIETGTTEEYEIIIENTGDVAIPINPGVGGCEEDYHGYYYYDGGPGEINEDWITISSPKSIPSKDKITVKVKISIPKDAKGSYDGSICLNVEDPAYEGDRGMWEQEVHISLQAWTTPTDPFTKKFSVPGDAKEIEIEVNNGDSFFAYMPFYMKGDGNKVKDPNFEVSLINPDGEKVKPLLKRTTISGMITLGSFDYLPPWETTGDGIYQDMGMQKTQEYTISATEGEWSLEIMPENAFSFGYTLDIKY